MTAVDHVDHEALVAEEGGRPLALAELVRDRADPGVAEIAFAVADEWQGRGLGRLVAERIAERARALGICRLRAHVVAGNEGARAVLNRLGSPAGGRFDGAGYELEVRLCS
jgi:GNAT superfamily N-acetyltransferase